ncbi:MAG: glycerophosphoryl diester phosphodiesterase membrane domain-containing protein [Bacteroidaceae bacterium]|nr:glycerophosphoryl diester phosphodiesterase membrane domain-containing protein [Bacteroidaceae bacterium]
MKEIKIGDLVSRAWDLAVKHWPIFVLLTLINSIVTSMGTNVDSDVLTEIQNVTTPAAQFELLTEAIQTNYLLLFIGALIGIYVSFVAYRMYVSAIRTGKPYVSFGEALKVDFNQVAIFFCVSLVYGIIVSFATCLCILPGIFFGIRLWYAPLIAATEEASFSEAFSRSWNTTKGHFWELFLMGLTAIGIAILGFCACCVGYYFAAVMIEFMVILAYFELRPTIEPETQESEIPTDTDYEEVKE